MATELDYQSVLTAISAWPAELRASLAHALIDSLKTEGARTRRMLSVEQLVGIARGDGPAPTDEQVRQWVDEYRTAKYGGGGG